MSNEYGDLHYSDYLSASNIPHDNTDSESGSAKASGSGSGNGAGSGKDNHRHDARGIHNDYDLI